MSSKTQGRPHVSLNTYSAVFFQDQSKRKETRMILFYVCTKCDHPFTDATLDLETQPEM